MYDNADKVFHLHRGLPIAAMTWGLGQIGGASIATLAKDFRQKIMGCAPTNPGGAIEPDFYSIKDVADELAGDLFGLYAAEYADRVSAPPLGIIVAGYSAHQRQSEVWRILIDNPHTAPGPRLLADRNAAGWQTFAQPQATQRLFLGHDPAVMERVLALVPEDRREQAFEMLQSGVSLPAQPAMPLPDAIALARYLVDGTVGYRHFLVEPDTVGGMIYVAAVSRHEGFKWISRKHYYPAELNPKGPHDG